VGRPRWRRRRRSPPVAVRWLDGPTARGAYELAKLAATYGEVQLATLAAEPPTGPGWSTELKASGRSRYGAGRVHPEVRKAVVLLAARDAGGTSGEAVHGFMRTSRPVSRSAVNRRTRASAIGR
jgi:hypothetical protein